MHTYYYVLTIKHIAVCSKYYDSICHNYQSRKMHLNLNVSPTQRQKVLNIMIQHLFLC